MKSIEIEAVGKFIVSEQLQNEIDFLHSAIGSIEWSGILLYTVENKDVSNMKDIVFVGKHVYLMNIGSSATTGFEYDGIIVDMYDDLPDMIDDNIGIIHSHHTMSAYHSQTDLSDLDKNSSVYNYYISLVVSFNKKYACKIAFPSKGKVTREIELINTDGNKFSKKMVEEESSILLSTIPVEFENKDVKVEDWFVKRYEKSLKATNRKKDKLLKINNDNCLPFYKSNEQDEELYSNQSNNVNKKDMLFATSVLIGYTIGDDEVLSLNLIVKRLEKEKYTKILTPSNIGIIHDNIYGIDCDFNLTDKHIQTAISILTPFEKNSPRVRSIVDELYTYKYSLYEYEQNNW